MYVNNKKILDVLKAGKVRVDPKTGTIYDRNGRERKLGLSKSGYLTVSVWHKHVCYYMAAHRLVALAVHGVPKDSSKNTVNHKNGNKQDNRASNLEWTTPSENAKHAIKHGLTINPNGATNPKAKLSADDVIAIRKTKISSHADYHKLANIYGIETKTIKRILACESWQALATSLKHQPIKLSNKGETHFNAHLSEKDVRKILVSHRTPKTLSKKYELNSSYIGAILNGNAWSHIFAEVSKTDDYKNAVIARKESAYWEKVTLTKKQTISVLNSSKSNMELANKYNVGHTVIYSIRHAKRLEWLRTKYGP